MEVLATRIVYRAFLGTANNSSGYNLVDNTASGTEEWIRSLEREKNLCKWEDRRPLCLYFYVAKMKQIIYFILFLLENERSYFKHWGIVTHHNTVGLHLIGN